MDPDSIRGNMTHKNRTGSGSGSGPGTMLNSYNGNISDFNLHVQFRRDKAVKYAIGSHDCHPRKDKKNTLCLRFTDFKHSKSTKHEKRAIHIIKLFRGCIVNNYPPCGQRLNLLSCADKAGEGPDISSQMCLKHALIIINPSHNIILT
jgi:hypothetical protein